MADRMEKKGIVIKIFAASIALCAMLAVWLLKQPIQPRSQGFVVGTFIEKTEDSGTSKKRLGMLLETFPVFFCTVWLNPGYGKTRTTFQNFFG